MRVDGENVTALEMLKLRARKVQRFSMNGFWNNIGCLFRILPLFFWIQGYGKRKRHKR